MEATSLADMIGGTPMHPLKEMPDSASAEVLCKLEWFNPGGSIKDRTALGMIENAEASGHLHPGMQIIESSSGNTAVGLAMLARERGYRVLTVCDRHIPATKRVRIGMFGADIAFLPETPPGLDTVQLRIAVAKRLTEVIPNSISLGQYFNFANPDIHYRTTGPEIWTQTAGQIDAVVVAVGTTGTISGVGRYLKQVAPHVRVVGVEPYGSVVFGGDDGRYHIQGGGLNFIPPIFDRSVVDEGCKVSDSEAIATIHAVARMEGLLIGGTGGLVVHRALSLARELGAGKRVVGIMPDAGDRYLDTIFNPTWLRSNGFGSVLSQGDSTIQDADALADLGMTINHIPDHPGIPIEKLLSQLNMSPLAEEI